MNKSYSIPFLQQLLEVHNLETIGELIDAVNNNEEVRSQLLDYLVTICKLKCIDSPQTGFYCLENFPSKNLHTYKYQENGEIFDERTFKTYGECLVCAEKLMHKKYYNPYLANLISKYCLDKKNDLVLILKKNASLKKDFMRHITETTGVSLELETYDGQYCLCDYPFDGKYSYAWQERGRISDLDDSFQSYEECLVYALIGNEKLSKWAESKVCQ